MARSKYPYKHLVLRKIQTAVANTFGEHCLEAEDLVLELADRTGLGVAEGLGSLLHGTDHGRRTAEEDLDVIGGGREALLQGKEISILWTQYQGEKRTLIISAVTKPTPPFQPSGGLFRT